MRNARAKMQDPQWRFIVFLLCVGNHSNTIRYNTSSGRLAHMNLPFVFINCTRRLAHLCYDSPRVPSSVELNQINDRTNDP